MLPLQWSPVRMLQMLVHFHHRRLCSGCHPSPAMQNHKSSPSTPARSNYYCTHLLSVIWFLIEQPVVLTEAIVRQRAMKEQSCLICTCAVKAYVHMLQSTQYSLSHNLHKWRYCPQILRKNWPIVCSRWLQSCIHFLWYSTKRTSFIIRQGGIGIFQTIDKPISLQSMTMN